VVRALVQILNLICEDHLGYKGNFRHALEQAEFIRAVFEGKPGQKWAPSASCQ
jgi:hypothetical protein